MLILAVYNYFMEGNLQTPAPIQNPVPAPMPSVQPSPVIEQTAKPNKKRILSLVGMLTIILIALFASALFYNFELKTPTPSLSSTPATNSIQQASPSASPSEATVTSNTGNSDAQLNKDSAAVDSSLNSLNQGLNSLDQSLNQQAPSL